MKYRELLQSRVFWLGFGTLACGHLHGALGGIVGFLFAIAGGILIGHLVKHDNPDIFP